MSYRNLIDSNLRIAFKLLKDLVDDISIVKRSNSDFDFLNNEITASEETIYLKAIIIESTNSNSKSNSKKSQCLIQKSDVTTLSVGDVFNYKGLDYKITNSIKDDGSILLFDVEREVSNG